MLSLRILGKIKQRVIAIFILSVCALFVISRYGTDFPNSNLEIDNPNGNPHPPPRIPVYVHSTQKAERIRGPSWTYECRKNACVKKEARESDFVKSIDTCWLTCGSHGSVWPFPKNYKRESDETIKFLPKNFRLVEVIAETDGVKQLINESFLIKKDYLVNYPDFNGSSSGGNFWPFVTYSFPDFEKNLVSISIQTSSADQILTFTTDESYNIKIEEKNPNMSNVEVSVTITGKSFFGIRHGLETLSQLIAFYKKHNCFQILRSYDAIDSPHFPYRGILLDSARNFIPVNIIKRVIDGMAFNKLNMLHWHLTDSNSFTFHSKRVPQMTQYGAISEDQIYFPNEIKDLVKYARVRGVKIIPEIDAPSHAGNGWQFGQKHGLGDLAYYTNLYDDSWPNICYQVPCGILNPLNVNTYNVLEQIYTDMFEVFDKDVFHMGGDEVNLQSWASQPETSKWLKSKDAMSLWKFFQTEALKRLKNQSPNVTAILWTSKLTEAENSGQKYLDPNDYIIQVWEASHVRSSAAFLEKGFSLIISFVDKFYLDWGMGSWLGREQVYPYHSWHVLYDAKVKLGRSKDVSKRHNQILGGEAPLWGEKVGAAELEVKLWPRAAALAENLWSNPSVRTDETYSRMNYHIYRLRQRGIPTGQLQPESCLHYNGYCRHPRDRYP